MSTERCFFSLLLLIAIQAPLLGQNRVQPELFEVPEIESSWDDLTDGLETPEDWQKRKSVLKQRYLDLLRDQHKPERPALDLRIHETVEVEGIYKRQLISYQVEADERAHAYLGIPLELMDKNPAVVALHGTYEKGKMRAAGLVDNPDKAYLDHLCRRGYVVIAPEHFVSGHRLPEEGPYETGRFYEKHPEWTAVGKFTYEHSIAIDVLETLDFVDQENIGPWGIRWVGTAPFSWLPMMSASGQRPAIARLRSSVTIRMFRAGRAIAGTSISNPFAKDFCAVKCRLSIFTRSSL